MKKNKLIILLFLSISIFSLYSWQIKNNSLGSSISK